MIIVYIKQLSYYDSVPYTISDGISEQDLPKLLKKFAQKFGTFKDGRVNYKNAEIAPIIMCTIVHKNKLLLVKRAYGLADAEGYWSTVNGFIDEVKPIGDQVKQEAKEELGINLKNDQIRIGESYTLTNTEEKRNYIVFPCLVSLPSQPQIKLNYENTDFTWIHRKQLETFDILADLPYAIDAALLIGQ